MTIGARLGLGLCLVIGLLVSGSPSAAHRSVGERNLTDPGVGDIEVVETAVSSDPTAAALASAVPAEQAEQAEQADVNIHNYNLCGNICRPGNNEPYNRDNAILFARFLYVIDEAETLLLQEVCLALMDELVAGIPGAWQWEFVQAREDVPTCPADDQGRRWYGNAILHRGNVTDYDSWMLSNPGKDCDDPQVECRAMLCAQATTATSASPYAACTSHFDNQEMSTAQLQAQEFLYVGTLYTGGRPGWLVGDFNLEPGDVPGAYTSSWEELVRQPTIPAPTPNRQIDYIWTRGGVPEVRPLSCSSQTEHSDHCYTAGSLR